MIAEITLEPRTMAETRGGIKGMSAGKTPCMDSIKVETSTLKVHRIHNCLGKVWLQESPETVGIFCCLLLQIVGQDVDQNYIRRC